jgi:hypothetical protein
MYQTHFPQPLINSYSIPKGKQAGKVTVAYQLAIHLDSHKDEHPFH